MLFRSSTERRWADALGEKHVLSDYLILLSMFAGGFCFILNRACALYDFEPKLHLATKTRVEFILSVWKGRASFALDPFKTAKNLYSSAEQIS